jgi:hypothetical protein
MDRLSVRGRAAMIQADAAVMPPEAICPLRLVIDMLAEDHLAAEIMRGDRGIDPGAVARVAMLRSLCGDRSVDEILMTVDAGHAFRQR